MTYSRLGFHISSSNIRGPILIPKYYNPEVEAQTEACRANSDLVSLGALIDEGHAEVATGDEIGKMAYGTGTIPFVRTSDIVNWEIKADPKQGVSRAIYDRYSVKQDVRDGDLLLVRDGTYLIGSACLVTSSDSELLYQSHVLKLRVKASSPVSAPLLLALLYSPSVIRQIRAKQFTADIIDTLGDRYRELKLPVPNDIKLRRDIESRVRRIVLKRAELREQIRRIPLWLQGVMPDIGGSLPDTADNMSELTGNTGFMAKTSTIRNNIFIPRYYNPTIEEELRDLASTHDLLSVDELHSQGTLSFATGIEVGKMAYGLGDVPFVRTSDISNWELKLDPKQSISRELYEQCKSAMDVRAKDILLVRDGTYLVGTSCILTERDLRLIYCGGFYKIRVLQEKVLDPYLLLAALNCPIVRKQMRAKQFTRDVIDTLGKRIHEVVLPLPKDKSLCRKIANLTRSTVEQRAELRDEAKQIALGLGAPFPDEDNEILAGI